MSTLVVYYSRSGSTKAAAREEASRTGADITEIKSKTNYNGLLGFIKGGFHSITKRCPKIEQINLTHYDKVIVCGAVWAGNICPPVRSFLKNYAEQLTDVEYILLHADAENNYSEIFEVMDSLCGCTHTAEKSLVDPNIKTKKS